mmetsp:Transcript_20179/g.47034  ORF Transcript_20179/g.47034 Transcript_20179/m.47034 type:complete len:1474 (+) Transcript_20179:104-4525(+)
MATETESSTVKAGGYASKPGSPSLPNSVIAARRASRPTSTATRLIRRSGAWVSGIALEYVESKRALRKAVENLASGRSPTGPDDEVSPKFGGYILALEDEHVEIENLKSATFRISVQLPSHNKKGGRAPGTQLLHVFRERGMEVAALKRRVHCLHAEVARRMATARLPSPKVRQARAEQRTGERHWRLRQFWLQYHQSPCREESRMSAKTDALHWPTSTEGGAAVEDLSDPIAEEDEEEMRDSETDAIQRTEEGTKARESMNLHDAPSPTASPKQLDWKSRHARGPYARKTAGAPWQKLQLPPIPAASEKQDDEAVHSRPLSHLGSRGDLPSREERSEFGGTSLASSFSMPNLRSSHRSDQRMGAFSHKRSTPQLARVNSKPLAGGTFAANLRIPEAESTFHQPWRSERQLGPQGAPPPSLHISRREPVTLPQIWSEQKVKKKPMRFKEASKKYINECEQRWTVPALMPFVTGHSQRLQASHQALRDDDVLAVATLAETMEKVEEIDLEGNLLLTDRSLVPMLETLKGQSAVRALERLSLKCCMRFALPPGIQALVTILTSLISDAEAVCSLKELDLSGVPLGSRSHMPLCKAVKAHPHLQDVRLADTGMASAPAAECLTMLLGSRSLRSLDIGWNCFSADVLDHFGQRLAEMRILTTLRLQNCSSNSGRFGDSSLTAFIEHLDKDRALTCLDVSLNHLDFRGALVLEDALGKHKQLQKLDLSENPLGVLGMRNVLRLLVQNPYRLKDLTLQSCCSGTVQEAALESFQVFSLVNPNGLYKLNLSRPYHRSLLRMLCKTADKFKLPLETAFQVMSYSQGKYTHPLKRHDGVYVVPTEGVLTTVFSIQQALQATSGGAEPDAFAEFLQRHLSETRLEPHFHKLVEMALLWKSYDGCEAEQSCLLDALSKDFIGDPALVEEFLQCRQMACTAIQRLLPSLELSSAASFMVLTSGATLQDHFSVQAKTQNILTFNADNPTWHYRLDLALQADFAVAQQLMLLDEWEFGIAKSCGHVDTSQHGNWSRFRNESYNFVPLRSSVQRMSHWHLPEYGMLVFDYVSSRRPSAEAPSVEAQVFDELLLEIQNSKCKCSEKVLMLRALSHELVLTCAQLRAILDLFPTEGNKEDLCILFYSRLQDMENEKVFRGHFEKSASLARIRSRLGHAVSFPFMQPEQATFELDFSHYDQRLAGHFLMQLIAKEHRDNVRNASYIHADGTKDPLMLGVPRSWELWQKMPQSGIFRCKYTCSADHANFEVRRRLLERHALAPRAAVLTPSDVKWWLCRHEATEDVEAFMEFLIEKYKDVYEAYRIIDGELASRQVPLRTFEEGVLQMKCPKFKGHDERTRIAGVFRYLDPDSAGLVTVGQWSVLELLFNEFQHSIHSLLDFFERNGMSDLQGAFAMLDKDGDRKIQRSAWHAALEGMAYYGVVDGVFNFLDRHHHGGITLDDFLELEQFRGYSLPQNKQMLLANATGGNRR